MIKHKVFACLAAITMIPGTPDLNIDNLKRTHREETIPKLSSICLVSLIKAFECKGKKYYAARVVKVYKGSEIPAHAIVILNSSRADRGIDNFNGRVKMLGLATKEKTLLGTERKALNYQGTPLEECPEILSLTEWMSPCGIYYVPEYPYYLLDVDENDGGRAMYEVLEQK